MVGAGITGICIAHALAGEGARVRLLDQGDPCRGSTLASSALLTHELDVPLHRLARRIGWRDAARAWRASRRAIRDLGRLVRDLGIECGWERRDELLLSGPALTSAAIRREVRVRRQAGLACESLGTSRLRGAYGFRRAAALRSPGVAVADPVGLALGILDASPTIDLVTQTELLAAESSASTAIARTSRGTMHAKAIVIATGYALPKGVEVRGLRVDSTWVSAVESDVPLPEWTERTLVWEGAIPYHYLRSLPGGRILIGGEDAPGAFRHRDHGTLRRKEAKLVATASRWLGIPGLRAVTTWGGAFGSSETGLPVIGPVHGSERLHLAAGFGGNGFTHAMLAARLLSAALGSRASRDAAPYAPPGPNG